MDKQQESLVRQDLNFLGASLLDELIESAQVAEVAAGTELLREGQYVKVVPLVLNGVIKVFNRMDDKDLLLYYIRPGESCIMSFMAGIQNGQSKVFATTEQDTLAVLLPVEKLEYWSKHFPSLNTLYFQLFNARYADLLDTINHLLFSKMDERLYLFLKERSEVTGTDRVKITHRQLANELGTAREVITRLIHKLEKEGKVVLASDAIEVR